VQNAGNGKNVKVLLLTRNNITEDETVSTFWFYPKELNLQHQVQWWIFKKANEVFIFGPEFLTVTNTIVLMVRAFAL